MDGSLDSPGIDDTKDCEMIDPVKEREGLSLNSFESLTNYFELMLKISPALENASFTFGEIQGKLLEFDLLITSDTTLQPSSISLDSKKVIEKIGFTILDINCDNNGSMQLKIINTQSPSAHSV